jgi:DNA modification methylase
MNKKIEIGDCVLYLGDCLEILPQIENVDHMFFDPPYEKKAQDSMNRWSTLNLKKNGSKMKALNFDCIDETTRQKMCDYGVKLVNKWFLVFCTIQGVAKWTDVINNSHIKYKRTCVWIKPDSTPQLTADRPAQGFENFIVSWAGKGRSKWNGGGKRGVYTHLTNSRDRHGVHPTEKPWRLMVELINDFTLQNETILDPFMGSGTTGVACVKTGRKFIGIEQNPEYFEIACERIKEAYKQPDFFVKPHNKATQDSML